VDVSLVHVGGGALTDEITVDAHMPFAVGVKLVAKLSGTVVYPVVGCLKYGRPLNSCRRGLRFGRARSTSSASERAHQKRCAANQCASPMLPHADVLQLYAADTNTIQSICS